jgi:CBS domain-containing protein
LVCNRDKGKKDKEDSPMTKCREIMTENPAFCIPSDPASMAARLMRDNNAGSIPVTADRKSRRLVGIITDRDLAISVVADELDPRGTTVGDVMTPGPVACSPNDDIQVALEAMERQQVRRIPVVDGENQLVGIIAQADIALKKKPAAAELVEKVSARA